MRSLAAVFFGSAAVAPDQSGAPVNLSISSQFHIGDGFTLTPTTNLSNQSFTPCGSRNSGSPNWAANFGPPTATAIGACGGPLRRVRRARGRSG